MNLSGLPLTEPAPVFGILFLIILLAPILAERLRVPGIIGLILAGMAVGPTGVGLLERSGLVEVLGGVGLLYLMFLAGVEIDLERFEQHRGDSMLFGASTFVIPMALLTGVCLLLDFSLLASLLIASAFTSHTLLTYPLVQRFGLARNRSVTATIGATLLATVAALLVLAVVASAHRGSIGPGFWLTFGLGLAAFLVFTLWAVPRLIRWFFAGLGQDREVRFVFILVLLFLVSTVSDLAGIEPIVGAFLAGIAVNRFVPPGSVLMERLNFLGSVLLVPLFLVATGMLIDPGLLIAQPSTLLLGLALTAAALGSKLLAAWPVALRLGFDRNELGLMFSLSGGQAAGALAAAIVGFEIELIDETAVNAVVLVILGTSVAAGLTGARYAPRVSQPERGPLRLGEKIVVPVANPQTAEPLVRLAAMVAEADSGSVIPVNVLSFSAPREVVEERQKVATEAEKVALAKGAEAKSMVRIDSSPTSGILHTVVEQGATCVLVGWKGYTDRRVNLFGGVIDTVLSRIQVPVLVCRTTDGPPERVFLDVTRADLAPVGRIGLALALEVAARLARFTEAPLTVVTENRDERLEELAKEWKLKTQIVVDPRSPVEALGELTEPGDAVVFETSLLRPRLGQHANRMAQGLPGRTIVAVVPRG